MLTCPLLSKTNSSLPQDREDRLSVGLVCRAWLKICAPTLYRVITVHSSRLNELIADLTHPGSYIVPNAQILNVHGPVPWLTLSTLMGLLPGLSRLDIRLPYHDAATPYPPYDPSHPYLASSAILTASQATLALTTLVLFRLRFSSIFDVLRLLGLFPRLSKATLFDCVVPYGSRLEAIFPPRSTHFTRLCVIRQNDDADTVIDIASFAEWWRWPHPVTDTEVGLYPGLHKADTQTIVTTLQWLHTELQGLHAFRRSTNDKLLEGAHCTMKKGFTLNSCKLRAYSVCHRDLTIASQGCLLWNCLL